MCCGSMLYDRYSEAAVRAGECADRNSAVAVIARWSLWASSGERGAGISVYYIFSLSFLSIAYIFLRVFRRHIHTLLKALLAGCAG